MLMVNKTMFSEEVSIGDVYYLSALFGFVKLERVGDLSVLSILGIPVFQRVDELPVLFGVNWHE